MAERMAVTNDAKMEQARSIGHLCDWLQEIGFRVATNHQASAENDCKWYAYRSLDGARNCECNDKPPSLIVNPYLYAMRDRQYASVELSVSGQLHAPWFHMKAYSIGVDELPDALPDIEAALVRAWNALSTDGVAVPAPAAGIRPALARAVEASEQGHDPFCMAILRGKDCDCGFDARAAGVAVSSEAQPPGDPK